MPVIVLAGVEYKMQSFFYNFKNLKNMNSEARLLILGYTIVGTRVVVVGSELPKEIGQRHKSEPLFLLPQGSRYVGSTGPELSPFHS